MNPRAAYIEKTRQIGETLGSIQELLADHAINAGEQGITWAHAGDLGHVLEQLVEVHKFLSGDDARSDEHSTDAHCTVDPSTDCCVVCGVHHADECPECGGSGFHSADCSERDDEIATDETRSLGPRQGGGK